MANHDEEQVAAAADIVQAAYQAAAAELETIVNLEHRAVA